MWRGGVVQDGRGECDKAEEVRENEKKICSDQSQRISCLSRISCRGSSHRVYKKTYS
jgi:hypothetical protein